MKKKIKDFLWDRLSLLRDGDMPEFLRSFIDWIRYEFLL